MHFAKSLDVEVLGHIYEAAVNPDVWPDALADIASSSDAFGAAIVSIDRFRKIRFITTPSYASGCAAYAEVSQKFPNVRPQRYLAGGYVGFVPDTELCSQDELETDPLYKHAMYPNGIGWTIGSPAFSPTEDLVYFDLCRLRSHAPFGGREVDVLNGYRPHLSRSALLSTRLQMQRARATSQILSNLGLAGATVTGDGTVLAANPEFEALSPRLLIGAFDQLAIDDRGSNGLLRKSLDATSRSALTEVGSIPIRADETGQALIMHLVPVQRSAMDVFARATLIIIVVPVASPAAPAVGLLSALYDLSPAEARLARALLVGDTLKKIADRNAVSHETLKSQLKAVFEKTGTHRQAELVALLGGISSFRLGG